MGSRQWAPYVWTASRAQLTQEVESISKELKVNEQIRVRQVRLIGSDGQQVGIVETRDALRMAREEDLDLVMVGEAAQPPVAKLMD